MDAATQDTKLKVVHIADYFFERYSLGDLFKKRDMLQGLLTYSPKAGRLPVFQAIHMAILWKETEEAREYRLH